jgi:Protein of unknown function (DUF1552)
MAISRRELLRRFGLTAASVPLLDAFCQAAFAAPSAPAKRLVCIVNPHGVFTQHWLPFVPTTYPIATGSPGNLLQAPSAFLRKVAFTQRTGCTAIDLSSYSGALGPIFSAGWQPVKNKVAFLNNLSCSNKSVQGHTYTAQLGGYKNSDPNGPAVQSMTGESIDVVIARKLNGRVPLVLKAPDNIDDVKFLEDASGSNSIQFANGTFSLLPGLRDPFRVWDKLFAGYQAPPPGGRDPNQRRVALLDRTLANLARLERDQRLSTYDRHRLDNHAAILEAQRANVAAMTTSPPPVVAPPARPTGTPQNSTAEFNTAKGALFRAQFKNAAAAIKLNKEQVISINTGLENEWLTEGINLGGSQAYHADAGHLANPSLAIIEECRKTQLLIFDAIAEFLRDLDTVEDVASGATYLDNTLVVVVPEHDGQPNGHLRGAFPVILAGGFGSFQGGRLYDYARPGQQPANDSIYRGFSYSRLLQTVLSAFNVTTAERAHLDIQGEAQSWNGADLTDWTLPLPGLT